MQSIVRRRVAPEDFVKKGPVQKLVLKGGWENRKWNDRWIELTKNGIRYCWKEGKRIENIYANSIKCVKHLNQDQDVNERRRSLGNGDHGRRSVDNGISGKHMPTLSSIWPIILHHSREEDAGELQNGFFIQTFTGQHPGREYFFRTKSQEEASDWIQSIQTVMSEAALKPRTLYARARSEMLQVFDSDVFAIVTTLLIALNFFAYVYDTQVAHSRIYLITSI